MAASVARRGAWRGDRRRRRRSAVMMPGRRREPEQRLRRQWTWVEARRSRPAPRRNALRRVIERHREVVARRRILAGKHDVAEPAGSAATWRAPSDQLSAPVCATALRRRAARHAADRDLCPRALGMCRIERPSCRAAPARSPRSRRDLGAGAERDRRGLGFSFRARRRKGQPLRLVEQLAVPFEADQSRSSKMPSTKSDRAGRDRCPRCEAGRRRPVPG